ncbi:zincin-like metallopeptidase domain-containing protein [Rubripirellula sp.]|nr:zincin-like metallopeptidase domain-containing protein [Rubripirellula sp.]
MASKSEQLRTEITNQIVEALESGNLPPWRKPWSTNGASGGPHRNLVSNRPYSGVNPLILELASQRHGFKSSIWATFNQWKKAGGHVKKRPDNVKPGKWGTTICFTAPVTKKKRADDGSEEEDKFWILKSYTVFNLDQVQGPFDHLRPSEPEPTRLFENFEAGDELIAATGADIRTGNRACYVPDGDFIIMPPKESFYSAPEYYETAFHELTHWTEPEHRLNWDRKGEGYAAGELIAEISSAYLASSLGIPNEERVSQSSAYLKSWLQALKDDNRAIFRACSQASKANDYLLSFVRTAEPTEITA